MVCPVNGCKLGMAGGMCPVHGRIHDGWDATGDEFPRLTPDDRHTFASGAMSSGLKPRYDLIPTYALERIARRFELGAAKYGENNWVKGAQDRAFILDRINHAIEHLLHIADLIKGPNVVPWRDIDDDAAAVVWGAICVMEYQRAEEQRRKDRQSCKEDR